ncbi:ATP-binding cassette domain-containing protein [Roseivivax marinus]|uniref:thiamine ABC transporter ATP-binding protein n=1 Tax=Roseivivax marinus TaxID=1379903 RepID=UPI001F03EC62|nr:ATP-binding cassette domain-containing protein [Roseivivax marinus]UMA63931.1 ATP-binding cassette domain-containing protein [Roseivivax marinus]
MLEVRGVTHGVGAFRLEADLTLPRAGRVAVIGPSGAGKSTLLDLIAGFRTPDAGRIRWDGSDLTDQPPGRRPVATLFQDNNLFPHLSVNENLALALRPRGGRLDADQRTARTEALERVGLPEMGARRPGDLSGGQQSRAALARVLLQRRPVMLLDEPFAALGPALKREMLALVRDVGDTLDALVLVVTHDPRDAQGFAAQTVLVDEGRVHPSVATETLFSDPPPALRAYLGD